MCELCSPEEQQAHARNLRRMALQIGGALCIFLAGEIAVGNALGTVVGFLAALGLDLSSWLDYSTTVGVVINSLVYIAVFGIPCLVFFVLMKHPVAEFTASTPCGVRPYVWITFISVGVSTLFGYVTADIVALLEQWGLAVPELSTQPPVSLTGGILYFVSVAVLPALLEELLFRGIVLRGFAPYGKALALAVSSVAFGVMHGSLRQIPYAVAAGFCIGFFVLKYNNFRLGVAVHFINNALAVFWEYAYQFLSADMFFVLSMGADLFFVLAGLGCVAWFLWKERHPFAFLKEHSLPHGILAKAAFSPLLLLFWGLCLLLTLADLFSPLIIAALEELL